MNDKELLQKAIDEGDFALAQQLLNKINATEATKTQITKRGRLSKIEIDQINKLSLEGKSIEEIASILNRSMDSIEKYFVIKQVQQDIQKDTDIILKTKGGNQSTRVQFTGNTFKDSGKEARGDKEIDKILSGSIQKTERRNKPPKVLSTCSNCNKQEEISPLLANSDPDSRKIYHICSGCIRAAKGIVAP